MRSAILLGSTAVIFIAASSQSAQAACTPTSGAADTCTIDNTTNQATAYDGQGGTDTFELGGTVNFNFQVDLLGPGHYVNWEIFQKVNTSNVTLINTADVDADWTILGGTLTASGGNSIFNTSDITVTSGTFAITANETIGSLSGTGGTVDLNSFILTTGGNGATTSYAGSIVDAGGITKEGAGTFTLSGTNTYSGATTINAGTITASGGSAIGDSSAVDIASGATLNLSTNEGIGSLNGASGSFVNLNTNTLTTGANNNSTTFAGVISGSGGLQKQGAGNMTLSGQNTYTGTTTINAGTLTLNLASGAPGETGAIIDTGAVVIGASGTLALMESETIGSLSGIAGAQVHLGSNTLIFGDAGNTTFAGVISSIDGVEVFNLDPDLTVDDPPGTGSETLVPVNVTIKGGIVKTGTGTVTLSGANTYTGSTVVDQGKLILAGGAAINDLGAVSLSSGTTLQLNASETIGSLSGVGFSPPGPPPVLPPDICTTLPSYPGCPGSPVAPGPDPGTIASIVDLQSFTLTTGGAVPDEGVAGPSCSPYPPYPCDYTAFAGTITGSGNLVKEGSGFFILSGTNTYTGSTTVNDGTLVLAGGTALLDTAAVQLNNDGALWLQFSERIGSLSGAAGTSVNLSTFTLTTGDANNTTFGGNISGTGGLTKEGSGIFTLSGTNTYTGTTTINAGTLQASGGAAIADTSKVDIKSGGTLQLLSSETIGALTGVAGAVVDLNGQNIGINATTGTNTFAGVIQGSGSLTKTGAGTQVLSGTNTFTGQTFINGGTLAVQNGAALSDLYQVSVASGGTLELLSSETIGSLSGVAGSALKLNANTLTTGGDNSNTTFAGIVSGTGGLTKTGTGTFQLSGANTYSGTTLISGGILQVAGGGAIGNSSTVNVGALGTLELLANETIGPLTGSGGVTLNANTLTINVVSPTSSTFSGAISGTGGVTKIGTGTQFFSGTNTYGGTTNVNGGVLSVVGGNAISNVGAVVVASGAEFELQTAETIGSLAGVAGSSVDLQATLTTGDASNTTFAGSMFGGGGLIKQGSGIFTLSGTNTFAGSTSVNAGTLRLQNGSALSDVNAVMIASGATLELLSSERIGNLTGAVGSFVLLNANTLTTGDASNTTFSGAMSGTGGLTKEGTGTFLLDGTNSYSGQTTINAGTLRVQNGTAIADTSAVSVASGATFDLLSSETVGPLLGAGNVTLGANTLGINATTGTSTFSGAISGAGGVTKTGAGTQVFSGTNTYGGTTNVNGGTLAVSGGSAIANTGAVMVASGATFQVMTNETIGSLDGVAGSFAILDGTLTTGNAGNSTFAGNMSGAGGLTKQGAGMFTLSGTNTHGGATTVNAGTLRLAGGSAISNSGAVVVAGGATLDLQASETIGNLSGSGLVALNASFLTTGDASNTSFSGAFSGTGGMTKQGSGKFSTGNLGYSGLTTINAGELNVNGTIAGSVLINAAGTLSGNTTIAGSLTNLGTLSSGNSPGPTIVGLDYTGGGVMNVEVQLNNAGAPVNGVTHDYLQVGRDVLGPQTLINIVPFAPSTSPAGTTGNGYELVRVEGNVASNAFALQGPVIQGGYEYLLKYLPNYTGTTDGFFLQSAPLQQIALNAAMLAVGRSAKALCEREDTAHPGLEGKRYRASGDVRVGNYSTGADTGLESDANHYCLSAGADAAVNQTFFLGASASWGETDADIVIPQGASHLTGSGGRYQAHAGLTLGDFYAVLAAGFSKTEWEGVLVGGGQVSADIKGGIGHLDAGYRIPFDRMTALTLSGRIDYDGATCGENCLIPGTVEDVSEWTGRAGLRLDTSMWNGDFRPFVAVGITDDLGDGVSVTKQGATSTMNPISSVLDADIGFNAQIDSGASVFVRGRVTQGLDTEIDGYEAAGGVRLMW